jgi:hypothetical protein
VKKEELPVQTQAATSTVAVEALSAETTANAGAEPIVAAVPVVMEPVASNKSASDIDDDVDAVAENPSTLEPARSTGTAGPIDANSSLLATRKPNLERHISTIESSSGSSVSDWDEADEADDVGRAPKNDETSDHHGLPVAAAGASAVAVPATASGHDSEHARSVAERVFGAPTTDNTAAAASAVVAETDASNAVQSEPATLAAVAETDASNAVESKPAADTSAPALIAKSQQPTTSDATSSRLTKPAPATAEPRQSTSSSRAGEEQEPTGIKGFFSKFRSKPKAETTAASDTKVSSTSTTPKPAAPIAAVDATATIPDATDSRELESAPANSHPVTASTVHAPTATGSSSTNARAVSPSSFRRRRSPNDRDDVSSISSASSSGLDEDDINEGRTGRMARALRLGSREVAKQSLPIVRRNSDVASPTEESDTFEEARDTFDEGLAPQPAFAGQAKSHSPARETRFREEV